MCLIIAENGVSMCETSIACLLLFCTDGIVNYTFYVRKSPVSCTFMRLGQKKGALVEGQVSPKWGGFNTAIALCLRNGLSLQCFYIMAGIKKGNYEKRTGAWLWGEEIHCDYWRRRAWIWQRKRVFPRLELPHHQRRQRSSVRCSLGFATWNRWVGNVVLLVWQSSVNLFLQTGGMPTSENGNGFH